MSQESRNDLIDKIISDLLDYQKNNPNAELNTSGFIILLEKYKI